jgi:hypothetical protein
MSSDTPHPMNSNYELAFSCDSGLIFRYLVFRKPSGRRLSSKLVTHIKVCCVSVQTNQSADAVDALICKMLGSILVSRSGEIRIRSRLKILIRGF